MLNFQFEHSYQTLPEHFYSYVTPLPVSDPEVVIFNHELSQTLGISTEISESELPTIAKLLSGNQIHPAAKPIAQAYAGHQFGHFNQLGDGRAHLLGEHKTPDGKRIDVQLKGSGPTPYARRGDGRAAIGPMLREYILSEAMHALRIPTSRSLAVISTGDPVYREDVLAGAILTRTAASHLRFGTFQWAAIAGEPQLTQQLLDYAIKRHYPSCANANNPALAFLTAVRDRTIDLVVHWLRVGFIHGVLNTDNMTISGETIDYGPCAFMDTYNPNTVFSSIDRHGRYAFTNQPTIAQWNLARLAETLLPLIDPDTPKAIQLAESIINEFSELFSQQWATMMANKIGLSVTDSETERLISELLQWMETNQADYTNTFYQLTRWQMSINEMSINDANSNNTDTAIDTLYQQKDFQNWMTAWQTQLKNQNQSPETVTNLMQTNNPRVIARNHQVEKALRAAESGNLKPLYELVAVLQTPYNYQNTHAPLDRYQQPPAPSERVYQTFCGT